MENIQHYSEYSYLVSISPMIFFNKLDLIFVCKINIC